MPRRNALTNSHSAAFKERRKKTWFEKTITRLSATVDKKSRHLRWKYKREKEMQSVQLLLD